MRLTVVTVITIIAFAFTIVAEEQASAAVTAAAEEVVADTVNTADVADTAGTTGAHPVAQTDTPPEQPEAEEEEAESFGVGAAIVFDDVTDDPDAGPNPPEPQIERAPVTPAIFGRPNRLDGIAAVVGSEIILNSELETFAFMRLMAMGADPDSIDKADFLRERLNELIDDKMLLVRAIEDSAITVRNDEVESTLNNHINSILRQNSITMEQFDAILRAQQGTTLARFRTDARRAIREQLLKQKLQQSYFFSTNVNRRDVERFYEQYADSLPTVGESFHLHKLSLRITSSDSVRQAAHDKIHYIKRQLAAGADFTELAMKYSESPEGPSGGNLGFLDKGSTTEIVFEERAFSLPVGRVSEPFETRLGYHIIVVDEKRDRRVRLRQILVRHAPTEQERDAVIARLDSLRQTVTTRAEFEAAARSMSADAVTRTRGGDLGWVTLFEMSAALRGAVQGLDAGQISAPIHEENMLSIYMVTGRTDSRRLTLENDYAVIAEQARNITAQKRLLDSVARWRERVFIDIRI